jgi:hypothetical protein
MLQFWSIVQNVRRLSLEHAKGLVGLVTHLSSPQFSPLTIAV